ncbi:iron ABC transporter permease [Rathayibacter rathayi]|uniref:Iron ABC transporter permease n=1 Tax=Rathayibacter rathayi TaxID=33887 RepID=A0ABD6W9U7_RATRA|nr:iron ABC transporter permease [Rathayibacter rathayi]MWV74856.1 iron chelate uptake ABC transporter family permease subunit [Rathayibacter rathayi NCPPB 2980 = VKM Ac-1601]PPF14731.1 iron ABC transporter permease [Rathayibacter rathayi]PPF49960.1 iron ABC transporter permease [Rathayibacter rathayi]PPF80527.1 iron ABC transporter permease [Rathayibacter rathayi]PPG69268.1 iron ABC transporter permease [Rathayibacter rathayi]
MTLTDLVPAAPDRSGRAPDAPRRAVKVAARLVDVLLPAVPAAMGLALIHAIPDERGPWQSDRIVVGVAGLVLVAALIGVTVSRGRRGQSIGMAALGLVRVPGLGVRSLAALRRARIDVDVFVVRPRRAAGILAVLAVVVVGVGMIAIAIGARNVTLPEVAHAVVGFSATYNDIVIRERAPRAVVAIAAGLALGAAGTIVQAQTRNPLADPDLMGITRGATLATVLAIWLGGLTTPAEYTVFSLLGALAVTVLVIVLAETMGETLMALPLIGAAVSSVLGSAAAMLLLLDQTVQQSFRRWMIGGLSDGPLSTYAVPLVAIGVGLVLAVVCAPSLNALSLGTEMATSLGADVRRARIGGLLAVGLLAGAATAACGPVAFLGLIAPHTARLLVGTDHRVLLPSSALIGAIALLFADVVGRTVARPAEVPAGIIFLLVGAPLFVLLARRTSGGQ